MSPWLNLFGSNPICFRDRVDLTQEQVIEELAVPVTLMLVGELEDAYHSPPVLEAFSIFNPSKLPEAVGELADYGNVRYTYLSLSNQNALHSYLLLNNTVPYFSSGSGIRNTGIKYKCISADRLSILWICNFKSKQFEYTYACMFIMYQGKYSEALGPLWLLKAGHLQRSDKSSSLHYLIKMLLQLNL